MIFTLASAHSALLFFADSDDNVGFEINYPSIALHAITNPGTIYCQLIEGDNTGSEIRVLEIRPPSQSSCNFLPFLFCETPILISVFTVEAIFEALSTCSALEMEQSLGDEERLPGDASEVDELKAVCPASNSTFNRNLDVIGGQRSSRQHLRTHIYNQQT
jgi:Regulator of volume decrease after cellular swelling